MDIFTMPSPSAMKHLLETPIERPLKVENLKHEFHEDIAGCDYQSSLSMGPPMHCRRLSIEYVVAIALSSICFHLLLSNHSLPSQSRTTCFFVYFIVLLQPRNTHSTLGYLPFLQKVASWSCRQKRKVYDQRRKASLAKLEAEHVSKHEQRLRQPIRSVHQPGIVAEQCFVSTGTANSRWIIVPSSCRATL